eukprot:g3628.t1
MLDMHREQLRKKQKAQNGSNAGRLQKMGDNLGFEKAKIQGANQIAKATQRTTNQIENYAGNVQATIGNVAADTVYTAEQKVTSGLQIASEQMNRAADQTLQNTTAYTNAQVTNVQNQARGNIEELGDAVQDHLEAGTRQASATIMHGKRALVEKQTYAQKMGDGIVSVGRDINNGILSTGNRIKEGIEDASRHGARIFGGLKIAPEFDITSKSNNLVKRHNSIFQGQSYHHDGEGEDSRTESQRKFDIHDKRARNLLKELKEMGKIYTLCGDYYARINHWLTLPTIIITAMSGFVSFLGGSTGVPNEWKQWIAVTVGFMATLATILGGFQSTFKWGSKSDMFLQAAQQLLILEGKLNFCIMSDEDSLKDIEVIQETMLDIAKGMRFFPPQQLVKAWWEMGMIDETQKREPLPSWASQHSRDLRDLGINEKNDLRFITKEMLESLDPPMSKANVKKVFIEKAKQGGIMTPDEAVFLSKRTIRRLKADNLWRSSLDNNQRSRT